MSRPSTSGPSAGGLPRVMNRHVPNASAATKTSAPAAT
jgi:hypothetical protein